MLISGGKKLYAYLQNTEQIFYKVYQITNICEKNMNSVVVWHIFNGNIII